MPSLRLRTSAVFLKHHGNRIQAIALPRRGWPVWKYMTKVAIASMTPYFCASHTQARILNVADVFFVERLEKAWPTGTGIKFRVRTEQRKVAKPAVINTSQFVIQ